MSLFKANEWWSTVVGTDDEFDQGCLCVGCPDSSTQGRELIFVGSFLGYVRVYLPVGGAFRPEHLLLEQQMSFPILQLELGRFVSAHNGSCLAVLHPRRLSIYHFSAVSGVVEHGDRYNLVPAYDHNLERSAAGFTYGSFGGVRGADYLCVLSIDGALLFFDQERRSHICFLPNFLLPGPLRYIASTDSFLVWSSTRYIECYRYQKILMAPSSDDRTGAKSLAPDWRTNIGEDVLDIQISSFRSCDTSIFVLGLRNLFCLITNGNISYSKMLTYEPSCILPYTSLKEGSVNSIICSRTQSLHVYKDAHLIWTSQVTHSPVAVRVANFSALQGVVVTLSDDGQLICSYLGTDPTLTLTGASRQSSSHSIEAMQTELRQFQKVIKEAQSSTRQLFGASDLGLMLSTRVPCVVDQPSLSSTFPEADPLFPSVTVQIEVKVTKPGVSSCSFSISCAHPLACSKKVWDAVDLNSAYMEVVQLPVTFYVLRDHGVCPTSLAVSIFGTFSVQGVTQKVRAEFNLPVSFFYQNENPSSTSAEYKINVDTNKDPVDLALLFPEVCGNLTKPVSALGLAPCGGGEAVSILSAKSSKRYRMQTGSQSAFYFLLSEFVLRLRKHFASDQVPLQISYKDPLPIEDVHALMDQHFQIRLGVEKGYDDLSRQAQQFRLIQRRLLSKFKDKTPTPIAGLNLLLEATYQQIVSAVDLIHQQEKLLVEVLLQLQSTMGLLCLLLSIQAHLCPADYQLLSSSLLPQQSNAMDQGWEEMQDEALVYLLGLDQPGVRKEGTAARFHSTTDVYRLKKRLAQLCEKVVQHSGLGWLREVQTTTHNTPAALLESVEVAALD